MSFVAGFYAAEYRASDRTFHSGPSDLTNTALLIFLMEGCEVTHQLYRDREVPDSVHFQLKPSGKIAGVFATVNAWQPRVEWKKK